MSEPIGPFAAVLDADRGPVGHDYESLRRLGLGARVLSTADGCMVRPE